MRCIETGSCSRNHIRAAVSSWRAKASRRVRVRTKPAFLASMLRGGITLFLRLLSFFPMRLRENNAGRINTQCQSWTKAKKHFVTSKRLRTPSRSTARVCFLPPISSASYARPKSASNQSPLSRRSLAHSRTFLPRRLAVRFIADISSLEKRSENTSRVLCFGSFGRPNFTLIFIQASAAHTQPSTLHLPARFGGDTLPARAVYPKSRPRNRRVRRNKFA
jgi:hypothetical protein